MLVSMELVKRLNRTSLFVAAIVLVVFGAVLLQDGLADAKDSLPGTRPYWDGKEVAIGTAFLLLGGLLLLLTFRTLPQVDLKIALARSGIVLIFGLMLSLGLRAVDLRVEKPYWFTSNVAGYLVLPDGKVTEDERVVFRERAMAEGMNRLARAQRSQTAQR